MWLLLFIMLFFYGVAFLVEYFTGVTLAGSGGAYTIIFGTVAICVIVMLCSAAIKKIARYFDR